MSELTLTDQNFQGEVLESKTPVLVDFWAPWCGPCRILGPIVEELAKEYEGKAIKIAKMNVDENQNTPMKYGIMGIPTLILFKDGKEFEKMVGLQSKEALTEKINSVIV